MLECSSRTSHSKVGGSTPVKRTQILAVCECGQSASQRAKRGSHTRHASQTCKPNVQGMQAMRAKHARLARHEQPQHKW